MLSVRYKDLRNFMNWKTYQKDQRYEVSLLGQVRMKGKTARKPSVTPTGYHVIVFSVPSKKHVGRYVHRMVMETFVGPCPDKMEVSHLNGDKSDNRLVNLRYESAKDNHARKIEHKTDFNGARNPAARLTMHQVKEIRESNSPQSVFAKKFGVSVATIGRARRGESWRYI